MKEQLQEQIQQKIDDTLFEYGDVDGNDTLMMSRYRRNQATKEAAAAIAALWPQEPQALTPNEASLLETALNEQSFNIRMEYKDGTLPYGQAKTFLLLLESIRRKAGLPILGGDVATLDNIPQPPAPPSQ